MPDCNTLLMAPINNDSTMSGASMQTEFMGIKDWTCEPSKLGLTPKEIEKQLNGTFRFARIVTVINFERY